MVANHSHDVTQLLPLVEAIPPIAGRRGRPRKRPDIVQGDRGYDSQPHRIALRLLKKLRHIVAVSTGDNSGKRDPVGIGNYVMFTAVFASIGGVWARFLPPKTARTDAESTTAREKSILPAFRSLLSKIRCILSQTPTFCQSRSLRQHVIPLPQPISLGRYSQPIPVLSTNKIPIKTTRSGIGFRPGYRNRLGFFGIIGSISFHNSSSKIGFAMSNLLVISFWLLMLSALNGKNLSFC